jgi:hypothetical protein
VLRHPSINIGKPAPTAEPATQGPALDQRLVSGDIDLGQGRMRTRHRLPWDLGCMLAATLSLNLGGRQQGSILWPITSNEPDENHRCRKVVSVSG